MKASYAYSFNGENFSLTPSISAIWQSKDMANYSWGVTQEQQDELIRNEKPILPVFEVEDSITNFGAAVMFNYRLSSDWSLVAFASGTYLDEKIRANPGINKDYDIAAGLGFAYSF